jgi:hypothetical protein
MESFQKELTDTLVIRGLNPRTQVVYKSTSGPWIRHVANNASPSQHRLDTIH